jgi:hypothetical protein
LHRESHQRAKNECCPAFRSNYRDGASIPLLILLLALGGGAQALAPAPAAAMIDMGGECGDPVTFDPSYCDENGGGGGSAGGGSGTSEGGGAPYEQSAETIVIRDPFVPVPDGLPHEIGGRRQARADGPRIPLRSRHGARPVRVAKVPLTRDECVKLTRRLPVLGSDVVANRAYDEYEQITTRMSLVNQVLERLEKRREGLKARLKYLRSISHPSMHDQGEILRLEETLETQQQNQIEPLKQKLDSLQRSRRAKDESLNRLAEANEIAHKALRGECERKYPKLFGK